MSGMFLWMQCIITKILQKARFVKLGMSSLVITSRRPTIL